MDRSSLKVLLVIVLLAVLIYIPQAGFANDANLTLFVSLFITASMALSWNILAGYAGQINLGHVAFFGLGSLTTRQLWLNGWMFDKPWSFEAAFIAGALVAAVAAVIVGAPALRLRGIYFAIGTLALAEALRLTISASLPRISFMPGPSLATYELASRYYLLLGVTVLTTLITFLLGRSKIGLGMMALREDEAAARAIGINVFAHKLTAFVISATLAGLTGSAFAFFQVSYYHDFAFIPVRTFDALIVTFVGGVGTLAGPIIGAIFFVYSRDLLSGSDLLTDSHVIIFGILFIAVVLALPGGLLEAGQRVYAFIMGQMQMSGAVDEKQKQKDIPAESESN